MTYAEKLSLWQSFITEGGQPLNFEGWLKNSVTPLEIHFKPQVGMKYYSMCGAKVDSYTNTTHKMDYDLIEVGNCYRTRQEVEDRVSLQKHVVSMNRKYGKHGDKLYVLAEQCDGLTEKLFFHKIKNNVQSKINQRLFYDDFKFIHIDSIEDERAERLRLIKVVYGE